ncbi:hypothetical protein BACI71_70775 [Bacillus mycoides]|uniref:Uncharacterized protein n=1 Tax=Bacillus mycoides TaxID=1405 RepID=A0A654BVJ6_BACMY|nr:hypothetical protein BACI71_70775 [Bacillus mycoides]
MNNKEENIIFYIYLTIIIKLRIVKFKVNIFLSREVEGLAR